MEKNTSHNLEKISKNIYDKELVSIIYKDVLKLKERKTTQLENCKTFE